jgi:hypothetical protein
MNVLYLALKTKNAVLVLVEMHLNSTQFKWVEVVRNFGCSEVQFLPIVEYGCQKPNAIVSSIN